MRQHAPRDPERFARLIKAIRPGACLLDLEPLLGGVSAQITRVSLRQPDGETEQIVVRQHGERDRAQKGNVALSEYRLLQVLAAHAYPAPAPLFVDANSEFFPVPVVVVAYVDGSSDLSLLQAPNAIEQMADALVRLHAIDIAQHDLSLLPMVRDMVEARLITGITPEMTPIERRVREAMLAAWPHIAARRSVLLHGGFWPGNLLWNAGQLAVVIDWEDATIGDPLLDLAAARLELYWVRDEATVDRLTHCYLYQAGMPSSPPDLPFWDLTAALDPILNLHTWGHPPGTEMMMRRKLVGFVDRAIHELHAAIADGSLGT